MSYTNENCLSCRLVFEISSMVWDVVNGQNFGKMQIAPELCYGANVGLSTFGYFFMNNHNLQ